MKAKLKADQISEAKREIYEVVEKRFFKSTTVHSTMNFTVLFDKNGYMTVLNGNYHDVTDDVCIEFDVVYNHGNIDFRQNRFYNMGE